MSFLVVYHLAEEKSVVISKVCTSDDTTKEFTWLIFISLHYAFYILCGRKNHTHDQKQMKSKLFPCVFCHFPIWCLGLGVVFG